MEPVWQCRVDEEELPAVLNRKTGERKRRLPSKNLYLKKGTLGGVTTRASFRSALRKAFVKAGLPRINYPLRLELVQYARGLWKSGPRAGLPRIDADACTWCVRDSLQPEKTKKARARKKPSLPPVVADDGLIVDVRGSAAYEPGRYGLHIALFRIDPDPRLPTKPPKRRKS